MRIYSPYPTELSITVDGFSGPRKEPKQAHPAPSVFAVKPKTTTDVPDHVGRRLLVVFKYLVEITRDSAQPILIAKADRIYWLSIGIKPALKGEKPTAVQPVTTKEVVATAPAPAHHGPEVPKPAVAAPKAVVKKK